MRRIKKLKATILTVLMAAAMIPQASVPVLADNQTRPTLKYRYHDISQLPEDEQIVDGGVYVFMAEISANSEMSDRDRKKRLLGASGEKPRVKKEGDYIHLQKDHYLFQVTEDVLPVFSAGSDDTVIEDAQMKNPHYDEDYNLVEYYSEEKNSEKSFAPYEFIVNKVDQKDDGNQGYTIRCMNSYDWDNYTYLNVKQEFQHEIEQYPRMGFIAKGLVKIDFDYYFLPTQPFVYLSNEPRTWFWDSDQKEFYTRYTTPGCELNGDVLGQKFEVYDRYNGSSSNEFEYDGLHLAYDNASKYAELIWDTRYIYTTHDKMGVYDKGYGKNGTYCDWDKTKANVKVVLRGVNASNKMSFGKNGNGGNASFELHDPLFWAWNRFEPGATVYEYKPFSYDPAVNGYINKSTATLGVFSEQMEEAYDPANPNAVFYQKADIEKLTIFRRSDRWVYYDDNFAGGDKSGKIYKYMDEVDLSKIKPRKTLEGAEFIGWSKSPDGDVITGTYTVHGSETLYARWKYTTTFDYNYPNCSGPETEKSWVNSELDLSAYAPDADHTPQGSEFLGWSKTQYGDVLTGKYVVSGSETLYAQWNHTVTVSPDACPPPGSPCPPSGINPIPASCFPWRTKTSRTPSRLPSAAMISVSMYSPPRIPPGQSPPSASM